MRAHIELAWDVGDLLRTARPTALTESALVDAW